MARRYRSESDQLRADEMKRAALAEQEAFTARSEAFTDAIRKAYEQILLVREHFGDFSTRPALEDRIISF